jgi:hypothetical protein
MKNKIDSIKRMQAARQFPDNTCPASRHVQMIAETLAKKQTYHMLAEEPEHCAQSMASVISSLYQTRTFLQSLGYIWTVNNNGDVEWVLDQNDK